MREVKFRGLTTNGEWIYGWLSSDLPDSTLYYDEYPNRIHWHIGTTRYNQPVRKDTEGQYIGKKDVNNKEVYEGDVVKTGTYDSIMLITYYQTGFYLAFLDGSISSPIWPYIVNASIEVIGNKFENPELMKEVNNA